MTRWTVAVVIELEAEDEEAARAFVDDWCNESSLDFTWADTLVTEAEKAMLPRLGPDA